MYRFLVSFRWIIGHLFVAAAVVVCASLGSWQLSRLDERREYNALVRDRTQMPAAALQELTGPLEDRSYRRVEVSGTFDPDREVLLRARALRGAPGYHVLTPLVTASGEAVLVDRGWVPFEVTEPPVQTAAPPDTPVSVTGIVLPSQEPRRFGPRDPPAGDLKTVGLVDLDRLRDQMPYPLHPVYVMLYTQQPEQDGDLPIAANVPELDEGPHLSYAVQWFLFIPTGLVVYGAVVRSHARRRVKQHEVAGEPSVVS